jgi:hypothetical protein
MDLVLQERRAKSGRQKVGEWKAYDKNGAQKRAKVFKQKK